jgi:hypothetical protein
MKKKREKQSSNFDVGYAKEKLKWNKEKISVRDNPNIPKEQKVAAYDTINRKLGKAKESSDIRKQEKAIYEKSIAGKSSKLISGLYNKYKDKVVTSKAVFKKNNMQVHIQNREVPSVLNDPNRFFTGELNKEKRSLYFS